MEITNNNSYLNTLVHIDKETKAESPYVEFYPNRVEFKDAGFQTIMETLGIQIPANDRKRFLGKKIVYLDNEDPEGHKLFEKVFREIYFRYHLNKDEYAWRKRKPD